MKDHPLKLALTSPSVEFRNNQQRDRQTKFLKAAELQDDNEVITEYFSSYILSWLHRLANHCFCMCIFFFLHIFSFPLRIIILPPPIHPLSYIILLSKLHFSLCFSMQLIIIISLLIYNLIVCSRTLFNGRSAKGTI